MGMSSPRMPISQLMKRNSRLPTRTCPGSSMRRVGQATPQPQKTGSAAREHGEVGGRVGALVPVLRYVARQLIRDELAWVSGSGLPRVRLLHSISQASVLVAETGYFT
jgi:hypothetical protein